MNSHSCSTHIETYHQDLIAHLFDVLIPTFALFARPESALQHLAAPGDSSIVKRVVVKGVSLGDQTCTQLRTRSPGLYDCRLPQGQPTPASLCQCWRRDCHRPVREVAVARMDAERLVNLMLCVCYRDARRGHPLDDGSHPHWPNSGTYSLPPAAGLWHQACSSLRQYYRSELHCPQSHFNKVEERKKDGGSDRDPVSPMCLAHAVPRREGR